MSKFESIFPANTKELRKWLKQHHGQSSGVWLVLGKKGTPDETFSTLEAIRQLLCFGWIDSVPNKIDATRYKIFVSPRNPKSAWSAVNKKMIAELEAAGLMEPAGIRAVELARQSGTWDFLNDVDNLVIPEDLRKALKALPPALENFEAFPKSARRGILEWIHQAKLPATRSKRIETTAVMAQRNERANQYVKK